MNLNSLTVFGIFVVAFGSLTLILWFIYRWISRPTGEASNYVQLIAAKVDLNQLDVPTEATDRELKSLIRQDWEQHLQERTKARRRLENDPDCGKSVWLSIFAKRGHLRHWAILTHEYQYELRRRRLPLSVDLDVPPDALSGSGSGAKPPPKRRHTSWRSRIVEAFEGLNQNWEANGERINDISDNAGFRSHYESQIKRHNSFHRLIAEREKALESGQKPEVHHLHYGHLFILHIGWTSKTKEEVDDACRQVDENFGPYNLLTQNCQHFARNFAQKIVDVEGLDWGWFMGLPLRPYQYQRPEKMRPPAGAVRLALERLKTKTMREDDEMWQAIAREQVEHLSMYLDGLEPEFDRMKNKMVVLIQNSTPGGADFDDGALGASLNLVPGSGWGGGNSGGWDGGGWDVGGWDGGGWDGGHAEDGSGGGYGGDGCGGYGGDFGACGGDGGSSGGACGGDGGGGGSC